VTGKRQDADALRGEITELFADLWQVPRFSGLRRGFRPQCDCFRTDDPPALHIVVELAGVQPDSVSVDAAEQGLLVSGTRVRPRLPGARYNLMEIEYGPFQRRLDLGEDVDTASATTTYENGVLTIVLPLTGET
jgi:HSP20 family molecular chaperone IbpA